MGREFQIQISTGYDNSGARKAGEDIDELGKKTGQAGEKAHEFNTHGREMHELFGKLNQVAPGLGQSLKAIFNPEAAPLLAVIVAIELITRLFEKLKEDAAEFKKTMTEEADFSGIKNTVQSLSDTMGESALKAQDFLESMREIADAQETVAEQANAHLSVIERQASAEEKIAQAQKDQAIAELELMRQKGEISPAEFDVAAGSIDSNFARDRAQREVDTLNQEKASAEKDKATAQKNLDDLGKQEKGAQDNATAADNALKQAQQRREHAKQELEKQEELIRGTEKDGVATPGLQDKKDKMRADLESDFGNAGDDELRKFLHNYQHPDGTMDISDVSRRDELEKYIALADKLQAERNKESGLASRVRSSGGEIEKAQENKSAADKSLETLQQHLRENAESVKTLTRKIEELNANIEAHKSDSAVFDAQDAARRAQRLPQFEADLGVNTDQGAASFIQQYLQSIHNLNTGRGTQTDNRLVELFSNLNTSTKESDTRLHGLLQDLIASRGNFISALTLLQQQMRTGAVLGNK